MQRKCEGRILFMTDFSKTLFHCSNLYTLMTNGRTKEDKENGNLSEGAKTTLLTIYGMEKYHKWKVVSGGAGLPGAMNGRFCEEKSIELINKLDKKKYKKNEQQFCNDFLKGTPDVVVKDNSGIVTKLLDVKSSWNMRAFFLTLKKDELHPMYWWQAQGYMFITGLSEMEISYCLVSPPDEIIATSMNKVVESNDEAEVTRDLELNYRFDDIPPIERRIRFEVKKDNEAMDRIVNKVRQGRIYLAEVEQIHASKR